MRRLVLVGAGHAHARVLLEFALRPVPDLELILVSPAALAPYSGMVPGWLAGHYQWQECCIDFAHLCRRAGASFYADSATVIDSERSALQLASGAQLNFDWLSLDIGSTLHPPMAGPVGSERYSHSPSDRKLDPSSNSQSGPLSVLLPMRPLAQLQARWNALREHLLQAPAGSSHRVLMIGGGAAGVESLLAAHQQLTRWAPHLQMQFTLATHGDTIVSGLAGGAARRLSRQLSARGIAVIHRFSATGLEPDGVSAGLTPGVTGADGRTLGADTILWATGAQAYAWPAASGLASDERGFVRIDSALRSLSHPNIFAAGDCAAWASPLPKAGVFAVRMGPILAHNLRASIEGRPLQDYAPQRRYLVLIGTGGPHAVASWGPIAWQGDWVWRWKQRIDRRFVARYNTL